MEAGEVNMNIIHTGDFSLVTTADGLVVGLSVGTGWYAIGETHAEALESYLNPPLGIRDIITWAEAVEALGV
jgi:hypothetical protein